SKFPATCVVQARNRSSATAFSHSQNAFVYKAIQGGQSLPLVLMVGIRFTIALFLCFMATKFAAPTLPANSDLENEGC
ncbi:hypothetical protein SISNIDRAFT_450085, partial [Sistotremastrum niveocremeum HHB9708]